MATDSGVWHYSAQCEDRLVNGGFEVDAAWEFPPTPRTAGYSETVALSGRRSARTGIVAPPDAYSYSSIRQTLTIPAGVTNAVLNYAWYPISAEPPLAASASAEPAPELIQAIAQGVLPEDAFAGDWQYALLLNADGSMIPNSPRMWTRSNARAWQTASLDLSAYRGRTLQITFGTLNDGDGRSAAMYVDDVSLTTCWPAMPTDASAVTDGDPIEHGHPRADTSRLLALCLPGWTKRPNTDAVAHADARVPATALAAFPGRGTRRRPAACSV